MSAEWIDVAPLEELGPGKSQFIEAGDVTIAVFNLGGEFYALEDACTHDGSKMLSCGVEAKFLVHGERLMCPRHGAQFCIRTGSALSRPATGTLATFAVRVKNDQVQVYSESRT